ncbi:MAG: universal stress protein [Pseudolabrys sp.]
MNANLRNFALWVIIVLLLLALFTLFQNPGQHTNSQQVSFSQLLSEVDQGRVRDVVIQGKPAPEIIRFAREHEVDMIVLGTHGRGLLDHALFGSTTERVVRKAPCPVLTCRLAEHEFVDED